LAAPYGVSTWRTRTITKISSQKNYCITLIVLGNY